MKAQLPLFCCLFLLCANQAFPCINTTGGTKYDGGSGRESGWLKLRYSMKASLEKDGTEMEARLRNSTAYNDRNDYAVALMYLGRAHDAVALLQKLEKEQPGNFFVAANLGTAYELSGNNTEALKWIDEGIKRNPEDHEGTEWLHSKILKAKIAQEKDATYFERHSVLELDPSAINSPLLVDGRTMSTKDLAAAIQYQLGERLQFVKPPDPAVASLLFDYASIEAVNNSMESAQRILNMATEYGYPSTKVNALNQEFVKRLRVAHIKSFFLYSLIGLGGISLLVVLYKRGIFVITR